MGQSIYIFSDAVDLQHKDNFDDWNSAFSNSIYKRTSDTTQKAFIGLSSGYDSGLISCCLNKLL